MNPLLEALGYILISLLGWHFCGWLIQAFKTWKYGFVWVWRFLIVWDFYPNLWIGLYDKDGEELLWEKDL